MRERKRKRANNLSKRETRNCEKDADTSIPKEERSYGGRGKSQTASAAAKCRSEHRSEGGGGCSVSEYEIWHESESTGSSLTIERLEQKQVQYCMQLCTGDLGKTQETLGKC